MQVILGRFAAMASSMKDLVEDTSNGPSLISALSCIDTASDLATVKGDLLSLASDVKCMRLAGAFNEFHEGFNRVKALQATVGNKLKQISGTSCVDMGDVLAPNAGLINSQTESMLASSGKVLANLIGAQSAFKEL
eukprot:6781879-Pyramimonas_sp.AAC.1